MTICHSHTPYEKRKLFFWTVCFFKRWGCLIKTNVDGSPHSSWSPCSWLQRVFVLIRAEEIDPGTGSDLLGWGQQWGVKWIPTTSAVINRTLCVSISNYTLLRIKSTIRGKYCESLFIEIHMPAAAAESVFQFSSVHNRSYYSYTYSNFFCVSITKSGTNRTAPCCSVFSFGA